MNLLEPFLIKNTAKTPEVMLDAETGKLSIKGNCVPEDGVEFFKPIVNWILEYSISPHTTTELSVDLHYFNTSASRMLLTLFRSLLKVKDSGKELVIIWYYDEDDEDIKESGEDYNLILDHVIVLKSKAVED